MPHRVAAFLRSHTNSFDSATPDGRKKKTAHPLDVSLSRSIAAAEGALSSASSIASTSSMPDVHHKRRSLTGANSPRTSSRSLHPHPLNYLGVEIESPPLVFYGTTAQSSGALLSGQVRLFITEDMLDIESFGGRLVLEVKMKKPFHLHCDECAQQSVELTAWKFLQAPGPLSQGEHDFPFSFLLPGHLPATTHGALSSVDYVFKAKVTPKDGEPITITKDLNVKRAIQPSETPRQSIRIFPPTNLTAHVELPPVIHPIGQFNATLRVDGIKQKNADGQTQTNWRLKRLTWRLEETQKVISPACPKHAMKAGAAPDEKKGVMHQDVRALNGEELKSGWKADYTSISDASIHVEFPFSIRGDSRPLCDLKAEDGTEVSHALVIELIVAEEIASLKRPTHSMPTGAARVLRTTFNVTLTERAGLGISWDEETPPMYEDVPASPPRYGKTEDYVGAPIPDYEELGILR